MRIGTRLLRIGVVAASALIVPAAAQAQSPNAAAVRSPAAGASRASSEALYSNVEKDFVVGRIVYLRSNKLRVGTIEKMDMHHHFPRTFPRPYMKAVLVRHGDGRKDWVPVEGMMKIYVVNR